MLDKISKQNTSNLRHSLEEKNMWIIDCIYQNLTILVIYLRHFIKHTCLISEECSVSINITYNKDEHYFK